jgi:hypothetical protein
MSGSDEMACLVVQLQPIYSFRLMTDFTETLEPAKSLEAQIHHLISLGGWNDVISIYLSI